MRTRTARRRYPRCYSFFIMDIEALRQDWAAWLAIVPAFLVIVVVSRSLYRRSARGQLARALKQNRMAQKELLAARERATRALSKIEKLSGRSATVKPRVLEEAKGALEDCRALEKILDDKCQVTTNHLRRVIFEEFPPARHDLLREKYLPQDVADGRPFTF